VAISATLEKAACKRKGKESQQHVATVPLSSQNTVFEECIFCNRIGMVHGRGGEKKKKTRDAHHLRGVPDISEKILGVPDLRGRTVEMSRHTLSLSKKK
jgi:hypothetical protein